MKKFLTLAFALVFMTGIAFAQNNTSTVTQSTNNNDAYIDQVGSGIDATVVQTGGNGNYASIDQHNSPDFPTMESTVRQIGGENTATAVLSRKNSSGATSMQIQQGWRNTARINPGAGLGSNEGSGSLIQKQFGNDNFASMSGGDSYTAEQYQDGHRNQATTSGNGKNGDVFQQQIGNDNLARTGGLRYSDSDQRQFGNNNTSLLDDIDHDGPGESYTTYQNGNNNMARLDAGGFGGVLDIRQINNQNTARVTWTTTGNSTTITQNGFGNDAVVNSN
jgi:hypothetical protein